MTSAPAGRIKFLLVDDLDENLLALSALLKRDGLVLHVARSGEEALELMLANDYALALLDVQMPGMDGFELAEFMRANERSKHIPIIFVTAGSGDVSRRFRGYEAGAVDFIQKPIEADVLRSKANVFIDLYDQRLRLATQRDELAQLSSALKLADEQKNRFLAMLGHELRNPLMALQAGLRLLERGNDRYDPQQIRTEMRKGLDHITRLVDDLLDIQRIERGKISLKRRDVTLQEVVNFAVALVEPAIEAAGHVCTLHLPEAPVTLDGDPDRLAQVFSNLIGNAARYTPKDGAITVSATTSASEAIVEVSDNGMGIPPDQQNRIFDIFEQGKANVAIAGDGLGIGLALVRQLVELHGGRIVLQHSAPGAGSTFEVRLPLKG